MRRFLPLLLLLAGCAYYNGLYNANRLADDARKAEREGRTGEARSLWSRAAVKAESVTVQFPNSRWYDDALLLWGRSLRRIDACSRAVRPLRLASDSSTETRITDDARILTAECRLFMREPDSAVIALDPVVAASGPRRGEALLLRARAHLAARHTDAALADAQASGLPAAAFPEATALALLGRGAEAAVLLNGLVTGPFEELAWTSVLEVFGLSDPDLAADLTARIAARPDIGTGARARLLVADGERRLAAGRADAAIPFGAALALAPDSMEARIAEAHLLMLTLRAGGDIAALDSIMVAVRRVTAPGGRPVQIAGEALKILPEVLETLRRGDDPARLFVVAEAVRDSMAAPRLALSLFLDLARRSDDQVLAPKAILAALTLGAESRDSLMTVLNTRYATSVYVLALRGEAGDRYHVVEDSLRQLFAGLRARVNE